MKDTKPSVWYFRFDPASHLARDGVYGTVLMGDVEPDRIYPCHRADFADILNDHSEWEPVSKKEYDAQCKADKQPASQPAVSEDLVGQSDEQSGDDDKPFKCDQCDAAYKAQGALTQHMNREHDGNDDGSDDDNKEQPNGKE